ncbi:MAG: LptF/LptG family permease [Nitrospinae bacterium]|nr:LptF/LptG family permease [Nitrospinota bacterium]
MKIVDRYVLGLFLRFFAGGMAVLVTLFTVILFFELIGDFINHRAGINLIAGYFLNKLPEAMYYMAPMAVLAAAILSLSLMSKDREVLVLMSCGVSSLRIALPIVAGTLAIAGLSFVDSEYVMPRAFAKSEDILRHKVKKMPDISSIKQNMLWVKSGDLDLWNIGFLDVEGGILHGVNVMRFTPDRAGFEKVITAKKGWKDATGWIFDDGLERDFLPGGDITETPFAQKHYPFTLDFKELKHAEKMPQEMNYAEISNYIEHIRKVGYEDIRYTVDKYIKITFPLISVVMAVIAIPFGLRSGRAGGALSGVTLAAVIGFSFWFVFSMAVSLGHSGKLPPLMAAFGAHALFLSGAVYAILHREREGMAA